MAINDAGQIVGNFVSPFGEEGFLYSAGSYTTINDPLAAVGETAVTGINASGQVVGNYFDNKGNEHGFLYSGGSYTTIDDPLATNSGNVAGINDARQIVGSYSPRPGKSYGFLYSGGSYTTINDPLAENAGNAVGINDAGRIIGNYVDQSGISHSFIATPKTEDREKKEHLKLTSADHFTPALFDQYAAAGFHNDHVGAGQMTSFTDGQGHQEHPAFLSNPHHHG